VKAATWMRVREVFHGAVQLPQDRRAEYLTTSCTGEPEVRAEVERLLAQDDASAGYLEEPAVAPFALEPPVGVGARIGRYTLLRVIASGGMGTVFEAVQDQPRRTVAVKTLRWGRASESRLRRFQYEAEVLGTLAHPGIAQVFEAGTFESQPYFAMEYVAGARDLIAYANEERLDLAQRLRLFVRVCDAVSHGHQKGVIHRDLKPGNVLVDSAGDVKVIDFGVARAAGVDLESGGAFETRAGQIVGTLQYMSPEQVAGDGADVDVRSDVYSLGCVLYELLAGEPTHDFGGLSLAVIAQRITTVAPKRPANLPSDLVWVLFKALAKQADQRYGSASEFRADLVRFLAHEPVLAGPPSRTYQLRKFARRHRGPILAVLAVVAALSVGLVQARSDARAAERSRLQAERETANARAVAEFLRRTFTSVAPSDLGMEARVVDALDEAARTVGQELSHAPEAHAIVSHVLGQGYYALGHEARALEHLNAAREYCERSVEPTSRFALEVQASWVSLLAEMHRLPEADELSASLLPRVEAALGREHVQARRVRIARVRTLTELDRHAEAEVLALENLALARAQPGAAANVAIQSLQQWGLLCGAQGRFDEQLQAFEEALALARAEYPAEHFQVQAARSSLAKAYFDLARWPEAEAIYRPTLDWYRTHVGTAHRKTLATLSNLANALSMQQDRAEEAVAFIEEAVVLSKQLLGERNVDTLRVLNNLAVNYQKRQLFAEAEATCREVLALAEGVLAADDDLILRVRMNLGSSLSGQGRLEEAEEIHRAGYEESRAALGRGHPVTLAQLAQLVHVNVLIKDHAEVVLHGRELLEQGRLQGRYVEWSTKKIAEAEAVLAAGQ
jgi:tetratricopeptide (TPR) repeat protein